MGKTNKGTKPPGFDYWSRRPESGQSPTKGKKVKKLTHKIERLNAKKDIRNEK